MGTLIPDYLFMILPGIYLNWTAHNFVLGTIKGTSILAIGCAILALVGYQKFQLGEITSPALVFYMSPLAQLLFGLSLFSSFCAFRKTPPRDVVFNFRSGFFWDRVYFMVLFLVSILVPVNIVSYFWGYPNGT